MEAFWAILIFVLGMAMGAIGYPAFLAIGDYLSDKIEEKK